MKECTMRTGSFGFALFVVIIGMTLGGCACDRHNVKAEEMAQVTQEPPPRPPEVKVAPRPPEVVQPARPVKQDRN
jgi:hypothetical protein